MNIPPDEAGIQRRNTFPEPYPPMSLERQTSPLTEAEGQISEKYDPVSSDPVENIAGLLVRTAVDIARYQRSREADPEHYDRLTQSAAFMAQSRLVMAVTAESDKAVSPEAVREAVDLIAWSETPSVARPAINTTVPYDGSEPPVTLTFQPQAIIHRQALPA